MQSVVETAIYLADAKGVGLSEEERAAIVNFVALKPDAGDEIKGSGGARKIRFGGKGKGKSGGFRVISFYCGADMANKQTPGQRMIASAKQALAFAEDDDNSCVVHIPDEIDVVRIRGKVNMSQRQFAAHFGVSIHTIRQWEQGRAVPSGPARALLNVIDREPKAVRRVLAKAPMNGTARTGPQHVHT